MARPDDHETPDVVGHPIPELRRFRAAGDPELIGRVRRGINRGLLAADGVDFSLSVFMKTSWSYLSAVFESFSGPYGRKVDRDE